MPPVRRRCEPREAYYAVAPRSRAERLNGRINVPLIARLKERRDKIQAQLDRWIARGFKGGREGASGDATQKETAARVSEVADLNRAIAEQEAKKRDN